MADVREASKILPWRRARSGNAVWFCHPDQIGGILRLCCTESTSRARGQFTAGRYCHALHRGHRLMGLNILLASDHYPPFIGGAHRQTQLLAHELYQRGHRVSVATVWHGGLPAEEADDGIQVYR